MQQKGGSETILVDSYEYVKGLINLAENFMEEQDFFDEHTLKFDLIFTNIHVITLSVFWLLNNILLFFSNEIKKHFKKKVIPYTRTKIGFVKTGIEDGIIKKFIKAFKDGINRSKK